MEKLLDEGDPLVIKIRKICSIKARNLFGKVDRTVKDGSSKDEKL